MKITLLLAVINVLVLAVVLRYFEQIYNLGAPLGVSPLRISIFFLIIALYGIVSSTFLGITVIWAADRGDEIVIYDSKEKVK